MKPKSKFQPTWPLRLSNASLIAEFEIAFNERVELRLEILHREICRRYTNGMMSDDDWKIS